MIELKKVVKEAEPRENRERTVTDKYSIETSVAFWKEYFRSPRTKRRRTKLTEAEKLQTMDRSN
jgi:hypothetical protein